MRFYLTVVVVVEVAAGAGTSCSPSPQIMVEMEENILTCDGGCCWELSLILDLFDPTSATSSCFFGDVC